MAFIYQLNQPPHPAWDFLRQIADQYGLSQHGQHQPPSYQNATQQGNQGRDADQPRSTADQAEQSTAAPQQQEEPEASHSRSGARGGRGCHGGRGGRGPRSGFRGGCNWQRGRGRFGPGAHFRGGWGYPPWWRHGMPGGMPSGERGDSSAQDPFNVASFLENLGTHLGINLQDVLQNMGATPQTYNHDEVDFVPRADIFDVPTEYVVHVSLPGAHREDISVDYDAANSTLRLAGVVFRPEMDDTLRGYLIVSGRDSEVGVFEKQVRLGTSRAPANVDTENISAKLADGVLIVRLQKLPEQDETGRKVPVTHVEKDINEKEKEKESENEKTYDEMDIESHTECYTESGDSDDVRTSYSPHINDEEEEPDYITVDVD